MSLSHLQPAKAGRKPNPEPVGAFKVTARGAQLARILRAVLASRLRSPAEYLLQCEAELHALKSEEQTQ